MSNFWPGEYKKWELKHFIAIVAILAIAMIGGLILFAICISLVPEIIE